MNPFTTAYSSDFTNTQDQWSECTRTWRPKSNPTGWQAPRIGNYIAACIIGAPGQTSPAFPNKTWTRVDLKRIGCPAAARFVTVHPLMVITHGTVPDDVDIEIAYRKPGTIDNSNHWDTQATEGNIGGGQRQTDTLSCEMSDDKSIEIWCGFNRSVNLDWPQGTSMLVLFVATEFAG